MASGNDALLAFRKEATYATEPGTVVPARFLPFVSESIAFTRNRAFSQVLGMGRWQRPSTLTTRGGSGELQGEVMSNGMGYFLDALHGGTVTPVVQGTLAYLQSHTLLTAPTKTYTMYKSIPAVSSGSLFPIAYTGMMFTGITFNWTAGGLFTWSTNAIVNDEDTTPTNNPSYSAPSAWEPFAFQGGSVTIGGSPEANIIGDGSITIGASMRDDAYALGTGGTMAKPVETDKPSAEGQFTADFNDLTNINRVVNDTQADVVLRFEGDEIESGRPYYIEITVPDCVFTTASPTIQGPGPVQQNVAFTAASSTNDPVVIRYQSADSAL